MLGATVLELVAHKRHEDSNPRPVVEIQTHTKETVAEKMRRLNEQRIAARKAAHKKALLDARRELIAQRDTLVHKLVQSQAVRKDGINVAKPGRKAERDSLRMQLESVNKRLTLVLERLNGKKEMTRRDKRARRDSLVFAVNNNRKLDDNERDDMRQRAADMSRELRPGSWSRPATWRRADTYSSDAMMRAPKGGLDITHLRAEHTRLCDCLEKLIEREGESPRVESMMNHVERLDSKIKFMLRSTIVKRVGHHRYEQRNISVA
jgi:hypothetical protein